MAQNRPKDAISRPDLCIIGAGQAGLALAGGALGLGLSTVLIEKHRGGGTWLHGGGIASRRLLALARDFRRDHGWARASASQWARMKEALTAATAALAPEQDLARWRALGLDVIEAEGRFSDSHRVEAGGRTIVARRFVIAAGAGAGRPALPGMDLVHPLTPAMLLALDTLPERLAVWGGTPLALELAQACAWLGTKVDLLAPGDLLPGVDDEMTAALFRQLRTDGVGLHPHAGTCTIEPEGAGLRILREDGPEIAAGRLLLAGPPAPRVEGLGLDLAGIAFDAAGIKVDADLRTNNRRAFAIGDVTGQSTTVAQAQAEAARVLQLAFLRTRAPAPPRAIQVATRPAVLDLGLPPDEARKKHKDARFHRAAFAETGMAQGEDETDGHLRIIATPSGRILSASATGAQACDLAALLTLAVGAGMALTALGQIAAPQPGQSELLRRVAQGAFLQKLQAPSTRLWLRMMRGLG